MPAGPADIPGEITTLLSDARDGRTGALDDLFAVVYDDLRTMARQRFDGDSNCNQSRRAFSSNKAKKSNRLFNRGC